MNEDAAKELVEFVGQLAASVAVLSHGMKVLMNVVAEKDREIKDLQEKAKTPEFRIEKERPTRYFLSDWKGGGEVYIPPSYGTAVELWGKPIYDEIKGETTTRGGTK